MLTLENTLIRQGDFTLCAGLSVDTGIICAIIGPSGGGKSTLLSMIAGFLRPTEGRVLWQGQDLIDLAPGKRPISILFQDNNLFPHLTVAENVGLGLRPDLRLDASQKAQVANAIERVGLAGLEGRKPAALSGGQMARAALARVLLRARPLILLDEPFAALGPALKREMLDLVRDVATETAATVLMVSHEPEDALTIASQTIVVSDAFAAPPHDTEDLFADPPAALASYLGRTFTSEDREAE